MHIVLISGFRISSRGRDLAVIHDELIPVCREYGDGEPHRRLVTVEGGPEYLEHRNPAVRGELEEFCLGRVRRAHGDPVAVADLADMQGSGQVLDGALFDIPGTEEPVR